MQVILLEKVSNLGGLGDQVNVRSGYGRNYLIPQGKAVPATAENIKMYEERRTELENKAKETLQAAEKRATALVALERVVVKHRAGEESKLYGSVGTAEIAQALTDAGVEVEKREVLLPNGAIHYLGEHDVEIQFHSDVTAAIKLIVEPEV
ncbi:MAG TPA: 50S ribosomal protein L9 [Gammaproteobacteria bacterium]|nr:50S ribosomal protein L9 [Gammaproteobacteria bacterium]